MEKTDLKHIAFLFPGQGAQYVGMGKTLCAAFAPADAVFDKAEKALGRDLRTICFEGPEETLNETENTQPCMLACELAALKTVEDKLCAPVMASGFSLGEWAALAAAEVLTVETAFRVVEQRALLMQKAVPLGAGGMAVILGKSAEQVEALCARAEGYAAVSNYNCPGQLAVAGDAAGIDSLLHIAEAEGVVAKRLVISVPSHCALMQKAAEELSVYIREIPFFDAQYPIVMNSTGRAAVKGAEIKENVIAQLTQPVRFEASARAMLAAGVDTFVELGPGHVLSGLVKKTAKAAGAQPALLQVNDEETLQTVLEALK